MALLLKSVVGLATLFGAANHYQTPAAPEPQPQAAVAASEALIRQHALNAIPPTVGSFSQAFQHH